VTVFTSVPAEKVCREIPYVVKQYSLQELVTVQQLRSNIGEMFRKNARVTDPKVRAKLLGVMQGLSGLLVRVATDQALGTGDRYIGVESKRRTADGVAPSQAKAPLGNPICFWSRIDVPDQAHHLPGIFLR